MKNYILLLALLLGFSNVYSQISVGESIKTEIIGKTKNGAYTMECQKFGNSYTFFFRNMKYQNIVDMESFSFKDIDNAFENLYQILTSDLDNPPENCVRVIHLQDGTLNIEYSSCTKGVVNGYLKFNVHIKGKPYAYTNWYNRKKIDKLFGKS